MLKELIKVANELDRRGYREYASRLDSILAENQKELSKLAGEKVSPEEAMSHEDHFLPEEDVGATEHEAYRELQAELQAGRLAELVVGGAPVFGIDPDTGEQVEDDNTRKLTELLSQDKHTETVNAILGLIGGEPTGV